MYRKIYSHANSIRVMMMMMMMMELDIEDSRNRKWAHFRFPVGPILWGLELADFSHFNFPFLERGAESRKIEA